VCCNDDRLLIEVHHQLAMTHISHPQPQKVEALVHWKAAVEVCERRVANLAKLVAMEGEGAALPGSSVKPQPKSLTEVEMNEIEEIAEDIKGRIEAEETQVKRRLCPCGRAQPSSSAPASVVVCARESFRDGQIVSVLCISLCFCACVSTSLSLSRVFLCDGACVHVSRRTRASRPLRRVQEAAAAARGERRRRRWAQRR